MTPDEINAYANLLSVISPIVGAIFAYLAIKTPSQKTSDEIATVSAIPSHVKVLLICFLIYVCAGAVTGWLGFINSTQNTNDIWATTNLIWVVANSVIALFIVLFIARARLQSISNRVTGGL